MSKLNTKLLATIVGLSLSLLAANTSSNGVYKWIDDEGNAHYSDHSNKSAEKLKVQAREKRDPGMDQRRDKRDRLLSVFEEERNEKKQERMEASNEKAMKKENCTEARDDLKQYQSAGYLYKLDEDGNRHILEGEEYDSALGQAEDAVNHWCG